MARRRRSVLTRFRSFSRNFRAVASILVGLGVVGGAGYFSMSGFTGKATTFANDLKAVVFGDGTEADVPTISLPPYEKSDTEITVGTFNIQQFGPSKLGKPKVMKALADTVRRFDVVAIQEITNINGNSLEDLVNLMNGPGSRRFDYLISTHLGNEQFGFVFDTARVQIADENAPGFVLSEQKYKPTYSRLPVVARFSVTSQLSRTPFTFALVNFHTVPDNKKSQLAAELALLEKIFVDVKQILGNEDDVIMLGDFNANNVALAQSLKRLPMKMQLTVNGESTMVKTDNSFDNIVFDADATSEFRSSAVFNLFEMSKLHELEPHEVSDHLPLLATFDVNEADSNKRIAAK